MPAPIVSAKHLTRSFDKVAAVDDVSFDIQENEFFSLLGPSGCGKTTLLRMIAGLEVPSAGQLLIGDVDMANCPANQRPVNMVFQSYAVFPHMSVADNVGYGLKVTGQSRSEIAPKVRQALEMVQMENLASRRPHQLSGGQQQRVALARALVKQPRVLLLDEPLSALDAKLREQMQAELIRLQKAVGITFIMVTHDQQEALSMSDRIAVMDAGKISQLASPRQLYERPENRFVASFIGKINLIEATLIDTDSSGTNIELADAGRVRLADTSNINGSVMLAVRPEHITLETANATPTPAGYIDIAVKPIQLLFLGDSSQLTVQSDQGTRLLVTARRENQPTQEIQAFQEPLVARLALHHCRLLNA